MADQDLIDRFQAQFDTCQAELDEYDGGDQAVIDQLTACRDSAAKCLQYPDGIPPEAV